MIGFVVNMAAVLINFIIGMVVYDSTGVFPVVTIGCMVFNFTIAFVFLIWESM